MGIPRLFTPTCIPPGGHAVVSRPARSASAHLLPLLLGLLVAPRPAAASGCHVAERPVFGLSLAGALLPDFHQLAPTSDPPRRIAVIPRPCSGDVPGAVERDHPGGPVAAVQPDTPSIPPTSPRLAAESPTPHPIHRPSGLDRPPRRPA